MTETIKSSLLINGKTKAIYKFILPFEELRKLGTHTNLFLSKSTAFLCVYIILIFYAFKQRSDEINIFRVTFTSINLFY